MKPKKGRKKKPAPKKASSLVRLGPPKQASYDTNTGEDLPAGLQTGMIEGVEHPSNHAATKLTCGVLGIATTAALGLYLYKRRRRTETKNTETEHSDSVSDPMEDVA